MIRYNNSSPGVSNENLRNSRNLRNFLKQRSIIPKATALVYGILALEGDTTTPRQSLKKQTKHALMRLMRNRWTESGSNQDGKKNKGWKWNERKPCEQPTFKIKYKGKTFQNTREDQKKKWPSGHKGRDTFKNSFWFKSRTSGKCFRAIYSSLKKPLITLTLSTKAKRWICSIFYYYVEIVDKWSRSAKNPISSAWGGTSLQSTIPKEETDSVNVR